MTIKYVEPEPKPKSGPQSEARPEPATAPPQPVPEPAPQPRPQSPEPEPQYAAEIRELKARIAELEADAATSDAEMSDERAERYGGPRVRVRPGGKVEIRIKTGTGWRWEPIQGVDLRVRGFDVVADEAREE